MTRRRARGRLFVVSSPSGGGKTTVLAALRRQMPRLVRSVSVTTRAPRPGERRGRDYRFLTTATFSRLRRTSGLLEWARVHGAWYGTPKAPVERALARGRDVVLCIDVQGARSIRRRYGRRATLIFLLPPSMRQLRRRLHGRRTESVAAIQRRLAAATRELRCASWYDARVINHRLPETVARLRRIIRTTPRDDAESSGSRVRSA